MGFWDALLGRTRPAEPNLDVLFAVPSALVALQASLGLAPTGTGGVCFKAAEGEQAAQARDEALALVNAGREAGSAVRTRDAYGYDWVVIRRPEDDPAALVTDLHAINSTLEGTGFGPSLLCTVIGLESPVEGRRLGLVYLFKRGTFYPFAQTGEHTRDNELELRVRSRLAGELPVEPDLSRWFPVWDTPAL
ncbi:hypothetical protein SAMN04489712_14714 [Thermomonospora echinospora]|uniref:Uncharacterized protein n=1 Tax=Thermomonospora echinospora TaxID=1992 RepID=A0A1H6E9M2_9ACTN|nr:hypothetical protein [Thermomonospora echinospora]SEG94417.1 hypothetical protein SAMN04489712_14714 [Thermomonospora echinospora]